MNFSVMLTIISVNFDILVLNHHFKFFAFLNNYLLNNVPRMAYLLSISIIILFLQIKVSFKPFPFHSF